MLKRLQVPGSTMQIVKCDRRTEPPKVEQTVKGSYLVLRGR